MLETQVLHVSSFLCQHLLLNGQGTRKESIFFMQSFYVITSFRKVYQAFQKAKINLSLKGFFAQNLGLGKNVLMGVRFYFSVGCFIPCVFYELQFPARPVVSFMYSPSNFGIAYGAIAGWKPISSKEINPAHLIIHFSN